MNISILFEQSRNNFQSSDLDYWRPIKSNHVWPSFVRDFFLFQNIGKMPLNQFKGIFLVDDFRKFETKSRKTWYSLTHEAFL
jgi:hypothetical protein